MPTSKESVKNFLMEWNVRFKYDRLWRKKYNIPFCSKEHLEANQVDIYLDIYEDKLIEKVSAHYAEQQKLLAEYEKDGVFLKERILTEEEEDREFANIRFHKK